MKYFVYQWNNGTPIELAQTRYLEDAEAILDRWYAGYIVTSSGEMIRQKRMN